MSSETKVTVSRSQAVAIFLALGVKSAQGWKRAALTEKTNDLHALTPDGTELDDAFLNSLLKRIVEAREANEEVEVLPDKTYKEEIGELTDGIYPADFAPEETAPEETAAPEKSAQAVEETASAESNGDGSEQSSAPKEEKPKKEKKKTESGNHSPRKSLKIRGTESYHAGVALKETNAADGDGKVTDETWEKFYSLHGSDGKNSRKGFMGAARQSIRAYLGHESGRQKDPKAYICGKMIKENPSITWQEMGEKLEGETGENPIIAKKAIQALAGYGLVEIADD